MRPCLVIDLDETLIHSSFKALLPDSFRIKIQHRHCYVNVRPGTIPALFSLAQIYELFVFTSSKPAYANQIIDRIAPFIPAANRFFGDSCTFIHGYAVKDLTCLGRSIDSLILIDDVLGSGLLQPGNVIGVKPWMGDPNDSLWSESLLPLLLGIGQHGSDFVTAVRRQILKGAFPELAIL
jgi:RNA polymerase II subunit A small phosphatase-like protein